MLAHDAQYAVVTYVEPLLMNEPGMDLIVTFSLKWRGLEVALDQRQELAIGDLGLGARLRLESFGVNMQPDVEGGSRIPPDSTYSLQAIGLFCGWGG